MTTKAPSAPRSVALVGPFSGGKTSLLENLLFAAGAISRKGTVKDGNMVGDGSTEARARQMSVEVSVASFEFMGESFSVIDCPGSLEFLQEALDALVGVDAAIVVVEPEIDRLVALAPVLNFLDARAIPYMVFISKMDRAAAPVKDLLAAMQAQAGRPLVLRQVPIRDGETLTGYIDLVHERAFRYQADAASALIRIPEPMAADEKAARTELLESLADFDDTLLEQLLEDVIPPNEEIFQAMSKDFGAGLVAPVLLGAGEHEHGVRRLLKALRHDLPEAQSTAERVGVAGGEGTLAQVLKTYNTATSGKLSLVRVWRGTLTDGMTLNGQRVGSVNKLLGQATTKVAKAVAGEVVALGRMDEVGTGDMLSSAGAAKVPDALLVAPLKPVYAFGIAAEKRADEVKLSDALGKLLEEDRSLVAEHDPDTHQHLLRGQGEMHLKVALDRLRNKFNLPLVTEPVRVPYKETIRKRAERVQGRHKKQTGGHGQFGDVYITVEPRPRGSGFEFKDSITGGVVPKQYIPAVETGVVDFCKKGPLGFPVVDLSVKLVFGSYHTVDSSEMAFQTAGRIAMQAALPQCNPVLLEPIYRVTVFVPNEFTAQVQRLLSTRRGQILGFETRPGWQGWDQVSAQLAQAEMNDLIIELRSLTRGVGSYDYQFDHMQELSGKLADDVVAQAAAAE
ncbi:MAG TPA: elongation factor G [Alphaproteobacteria bacterium]